MAAGLVQRMFTTPRAGTGLPTLHGRGVLLDGSPGRQQCGLQGVPTPMAVVGEQGDSTMMQWIPLMILAIPVALAGFLAWVYFSGGGHPE